MARCVTLLALILLLPIGHAADSPEPPVVNARSWLLVDHNSGRRLASRKSDRRVTPAQFTKLMVAYIALNAIKNGELAADTSILVSQKAAQTSGPRMFASSSSRVTAQELLKAMIVGGANDAAIALAEHIGSDEQAFVSMMNNEAVRLGLQNTSFRDVTGNRRDRQYTNADDLAVLVKNIINDHPQHYQWFSQREFIYNGITLYNRNALLWRNDNVDGLMATQNERDGYHLIVSGKRDNMRLSAIVLSAPNERSMITAGSELLKYGFKQFETRKLYSGKKGAVNMRVWLGDTDIVPVGLKKDLYVTLVRGEFDDLRATLSLTGPPYAPIERGQAMGTLSLATQDKSIGEYELVSLSSVAEGGFFSRIFDRAEMWLRDVPDPGLSTQVNQKQ
ncbi:MAG: D-alanyl-D-alanine carboxypeptidase family protein [Acidiferrobacterales bacterium]